MQFWKLYIHVGNAKSIRRNGYIKNNVCMVKVKLSDDNFHDIYNDRLFDRAKWFFKKKIILGKKVVPNCVANGREILR